VASREPPSALGTSTGWAPFDLRGGAAYSRELWNPTAGIGLNLGQRLSLDMAAYGTTANAERERRMAFAFSLRINR
jgi:hypothetical protein